MRLNHALVCYLYFRRKAVTHLVSFKECDIKIDYQMQSMRPHTNLITKVPALNYTARLLSLIFQVMERVYN